MVRQARAGRLTAQPPTKSMQHRLLTPADRARWLATALALILSGLLFASLTACSTGQSAGPGAPGKNTPSAQASAPHPSASSTPSNGKGRGKAPSTSKPSSKTAPVPPPVKPHGNIKQKTATHKISYEPRVPLGKGARFASNVAVKITKVWAVDAKPIGPGEVGGSAVALNVKVTNHGSKSLNLETTTITLLGSDGSPGLLTTGGDANPLTGMLSSGDSAEGTYVFTIAAKLRKPVTVQVQYGSGRTVLQFSGNAA